MRIRHVFAPACAVLMLGGCTSGSEETGGGSAFESIDALRSAVEEAGVECPDPEESRDLDFPGDRSTCGRFMTLTVYDDPADAMASYEDLAATGSTRFDILVGENWTVLDAGLILRDSQIPKIEEAIGGTSYQIGEE